jgi:hypothetical protein
MLRAFTFAAILALGLPGYAAAQNATCPSSNRLRLVDPANGAQVNLLDGASYRVVIGNIHRFGSDVPPSETVVQAAVIRNGQCVVANALGLFIVRRDSETSARPSLTANSNLCMGNAADTVEIVASERNISCGSSSFRMYPLNYGGFRLSVYGNGGGDTLAGGAGSDTLFGGSGNDVMVGGSGSSDFLYGESENDNLIGSAASSVTLDGGSGNDTISTQCRAATIACGSGTDTAYSRDPRPFFTLCESWIQQTCF